MNKRNNSVADKYKTNYQIKSDTVRIVSGIDALGIYNTRDAIKMAENLNMDLIEINGNSNPPICKILSLDKFLYEIKKKKKELESNASKSVLKELRMTPNIGENDIETKKRQATEFLSKNNKVKFVIVFKGRTIKYKDNGELVLLKIIEDLSNIAVPESMPKLEGNKMSVILKSSKK